MTAVNEAIAAGVTRVTHRIAAAAARAGRDPAVVKLVAVAKGFGADAVAGALAAGVTAVGENRAQELREKVAVLGRRAEWHFVGHLQANKVNHVVGVATLIHSVDRLGLAEAIARRGRLLGIEQGVLIEVNLASEATKHGLEPGRVAAFATEIAGLEGIVVSGLMAIPPAAADPEASRDHFRYLASLRDDVAARVPTATELSMGMSADFEVAIEEGATLVRVGEAIFGSRRRAP